MIQLTRGVSVIFGGTRMSIQDIVTPGGRREMVSFHVGEQAFCVDIGGVREIRGWAPVTPLPNAPDYVRGVINLRGMVLPVVDLAARLGLGTTQPTARSVIIVANISGRVAGLLVDAVSDILTVTNDLVQPTPDVGCDQETAFVIGLIAMEDRMISLVSLDKMLPEQELLAA